MPVARGYALDLYCQNQSGEFDKSHRYNGVFFMSYPVQYSGESYAECRRYARWAGWTFHRNGEVSCPLCTGRMKGRWL